MKNKMALYITLLVIGLAIFILEIFVFQKPDGILGLIICLASIYLVIGSIIKLCKLSTKFKKVFENILDILFWLP